VLARLTAPRNTTEHRVITGSSSAGTSIHDLENVGESQLRFVTVELLD